MDVTNNTKVEEYRISISALEFDVIHRVRQMRIKKGLSLEDLSFLLGYNKNYVRDIEDPTSKATYDMALINYLPKILDCQIQDLIANFIPGDDHIQITVKKRIANKRIYYDIKQFAGNNKRNDAVEFRFEDALPSKKTDKKNEQVKMRTRGRPRKGDSVSTQISVDNAKQNASTFIAELFYGNFFGKPRLPLDIFNLCKKNVNGQIRCNHVEEALAVYTRKKKAPRLMRIKNAETRWTYVKEV